MEKKVISVIKAIFVDLLIVVAIMFIYPLESIIMPIGMSIFSNSSSDKDLIKGFGNVRIENYKKYEKIESDDVYVDCYAIYFNEKQSNDIVDNQGNIYNLYELYSGKHRKYFFGKHFLNREVVPFMIKYIYSNKKLSLQVHPKEKKETWLFFER